MSQNYCFDDCPHNKIERNHWSDIDENGKVVRYSKASTGTNEKLKCLVGYKQTINSHKAYLNSKKNNSIICPALKKLFGGR